MNFIDVYKKRRLLFDGAMGTTIIKRGLVSNGCIDSLALTNPSALTEIHKQYVSAGADIIETNTFGANYYKLSAFGYENKVWDINLAAAKAARNARDSKVFIAGDIGPTGKIIEPYGPLSSIDAFNAYYKQSSALAAGKVDLLLIETMSDLCEARLAFLAAKDATNLPIIVSMTYDNGRTLMGNPPSVVAAMFSRLGADGIGVNCSGGPDDILPIVKQYASFGVPITAMPNAGLPQAADDGSVVFPLDPDTFADSMLPLSEHCVCIGGCCGTTPKHIRELRIYSNSIMPPSTEKVDLFVNPRKTFEVSQCQTWESVDITDDDLTGKIIDSEADGVIINIDCTFSHIKDLVNSLASVYCKPFIFKSSSFEALDLALFTYCGICGFMLVPGDADAEEVLTKKYGAYPY